MLSKTENKIMAFIVERVKNKSSLLVNPSDFINAVGLKGMTHDQLELNLEALSADGYFDLIYSDRHGERVYCISVTGKGKAYKRNGQQIKRNLIYKLIITVVFAFLSFIIGLILKAVF